MAYALVPHEAPHTATRRITGEQVDDALGHLDIARTAARTGDEATVNDAVHQARKCGKRLRGLFRLVRPGLGADYAAANRAARDAGRELSAVRDAHVLVEAFDALVAQQGVDPTGAGIVGVRARLDRSARDATADLVADPEVLARTARDLEGLRAAMATWTTDVHPDRQVSWVAAGVARTAARARARMVDVLAADEPSDVVLHDWRKRVKYSWYHTTLVEPAAPTLLGTEADLLHRLSDALGDDHDLAVLAATVASDDPSWTDPGSVMRHHVRRARRDLQRHAIGIGVRLHAEDPDARGGRLATLLRAWWDHGQEPSDGTTAGSSDTTGDTTGQEHAG